MLLIDVGNTKTSLGWVSDHRIVASWKVASNKHRLVDEYRALLHSLIISQTSTAQPIKFDMTTPVILSSVVPSVTPELFKLNHAVHVVNYQSPTHFTTALEQPQSLGSDRIADAEATVHEYTLPAIVIDLGTASTLSFIDRSKVFRGGAITAGVGLSAKALFTTATSLPEMALSACSSHVGTNTHQALQVGLINGHARMLDALVYQIKQEMNEPHASVIVTGGAVELLAPLLDSSYIIDPQLTLKGLMYLGENLLHGKGSKHG